MTFHSSIQYENLNIEEYTEIKYIGEWDSLGIGVTITTDLSQFNESEQEDIVRLCHNNARRFVREYSRF